MTESTNPAEDRDKTSRYVRRALGGDVAAFTKLVERFDPLLRAAADHHMGPALRRITDPEDLVMETWGVAWRRLGEIRLDGPSATRSMLAFLSATLRYHVANLLRKNIRRMRSGDGARGEDRGADALDLLPADVTNVTARARTNEAHSLVRRAIDALESQDRSILVLRGIELLPNAEAAQILGIDPNTCAVRWKRALERLKAALPDSVFAELD